MGYNRNMSRLIGRRTITSLGALSLYRFADAVTSFVFDSVGGTILGVIISLSFNSVVGWTLFLLTIYVSIGELSSIVRDDYLERGVIAVSATAYAVVWHAMYFRYRGPLPPTIEQSAFRMVAVTIGTVVLLYFVAATTDDSSRVATLTIGCFALGLVGGLVSGLTPVPEMLILGGIAWFGFGRSESATTQPMASLKVVDIEDRLLRGIIEAAKNDKGRYALLIALTGFVTSVMFFAAIFGMFYIDYGGGEPTSGWGAFLVVGVLFTTYAIYGAWFWLRVLQRIPNFIQVWSGGLGTSSVVRPVGLFVPASIFSTGLLFFENTSVFLSLGGLLTGLIAILGSIAVTINRQPQSSASDQYAIPIAFAIQFIPLVVLGFSNALVPLIILPFVYFLPEIREDLDELSTVLLTGLLIVVFVGLLWPVTVNRLLGLAVLPAEMALITTILESISEYTETTGSRRS